MDQYDAIACKQSVVKYWVDVCACSFISAACSLQVDVIVSEWMGYALLFEAMLDTVLYARDRSASANHTFTARKIE